MITDNFAFISNYVCRESIKNLNKHLSESELKSFSNNDYYYLTAIYHLGKPNFSQIADELGLTKPAISILVKKLMKMNLIEKVQSEEDKRVYYISFTEKGKKIVEGDETLYLSLSSLIKSFLTDHEQYEFINTLLEKVVLSLKKEN
jgi:DNA-binding MarR family transcriptional regulator